MRDTIYALSSGQPPAGVAVIRISGSRTRFGLETLTSSVPAPRMARLCDIRDSAGRLLDQGLALFFPAPRSFTGEDVAELQIHGSRASISAVLAALSDLDGFRMAEAGEFTRRAFENGRMDLTAVEGLADLIQAETESQRRQALGQAGGRLKDLYDGWATRLTRARALIEADIDFADEDDVPGSIAASIWPDIARLSEEIDRHLSGARAGEIVRSGFRVALIGPPNVGKSSLLNCLAQRDVAIVSDMAGTTRDVIEVRLDIAGHLVLMMDTAGIRSSDNPVELEGIRRSLMAAGGADLVLELRSLAGSEPPLSENLSADRLVVWTKSDLAEAAGAPESGVTVSSRTGAGFEELIAAIADRLDTLDAGSDEAVPTRERHIRLLKECLGDLQSALSDADAPIEIRSERLRSASNSLGKITGTVDVEHLLGVIFSEFCIGK